MRNAEIMRNAKPGRFGIQKSSSPPPPTQSKHTLYTEIKATPPNPQKHKCPMTLTPTILWTRVLQEEGVPLTSFDITACYCINLETAGSVVLKPPHTSDYVRKAIKKLTSFGGPLPNRYCAPTHAGNM